MQFWAQDFQVSKLLPPSCRLATVTSVWWTPYLLRGSMTLMWHQQRRLQKIVVVIGSLRFMSRSLPQAAHPCPRRTVAKKFEKKEKSSDKQWRPWWSTFSWDCQAIWGNLPAPEAVGLRPVLACSQLLTTRLAPGRIWLCAVEAKALCYDCSERSKTVRLWDPQHSESKLPTPLAMAEIAPKIL